MIERFHLTPRGWSKGLKRAIQDAMRVADTDQDFIRGTIQWQIHKNFRQLEHGGSVPNMVGSGWSKKSVSWPDTRHEKTRAVRRHFGLGDTPMLQIQKMGMGGVIEEAYTSYYTALGRKREGGSFFTYGAAPSKDAEKGRINQLGLRVDSFVRGMNVPKRPFLFWTYNMLDPVVMKMKGRFRKGIRGIR